MAIIPDKTTKLYYSIKEVGEMFGLKRLYVEILGKGVSFSQTEGCWQ